VDEDKKLLEVSVEAEDLPDRLLVNGVEYRRIGEPPDSYSRALVEALAYFEGRYPGYWQDLLAYWQAMRIRQGC